MRSFWSDIRPSVSRLSPEAGEDHVQPHQNGGWIGPLVAAAPVAEIEEPVVGAIEAPPAEAEAAVIEGAAEQKSLEETPKPMKRGRGRPPKDAAADATPNKRAKRTKAQRLL